MKLSTRLFLCIYFLYFGNCFSQNISYDFETKKLVTPDIGEKEKISVEVNHINLYLYKVELATKSTVLNKKVPKIIKEILPNEDTSIEDLFKNIIKVFSQGGNGSQPVSDDKFMKELGILDTKYQDIVKKDREFFQKMLNIYNPNYKFSATDNIKPDEIKASFVMLNVFEDLLFALVNDNSLSDEVKNRINSVKAKYERINYNKRFRDYAIFANNFTEKNFKYTSAPIIAEGDEMEFFLKITPRSGQDSMFFVPLRTDSIRFNLPVKRRNANISFSSGIFMSSLHNESYTYSPIFKANSKTDIDFYGLELENIRKSTVGVNSMVHFMKNFGNLNAGLHLGFGIPLEKKLNIHTFYGVSLAIGSKERIILNFGRTSGLVNVLSKAVKLDQQFKDTKVDIPYIRTLSSGWSGSITFNFYNK